MEWSDRDLHEAGIVTMRRRLDGAALGVDPREIRNLIRKVAQLEKAVAQRDALINLYQQRVEALTAELEGRKKSRFSLFGR